MEAHPGEGGSQISGMWQNLKNEITLMYFYTALYSSVHPVEEVRSSLLNTLFKFK